MNANTHGVWRIKFGAPTAEHGWLQDDNQRLEMPYQSAKATAALMTSSMNRHGVRYYYEARKI